MADGEIDLWEKPNISLFGYPPHLVAIDRVSRKSLDSKRSQGGADGNTLGNISGHANGGEGRRGQVLDSRRE